MFTRKLKCVLEGVKRKKPFDSLSHSGKVNEFYIYIISLEKRICRLSLCRWRKSLRNKQQSKLKREIY